jgi:hypothetical protein
MCVCTLRVALKHPEWAASKIITALVRPGGANRGDQTTTNADEVGQEFQKRCVLSTLVNYPFRGRYDSL